MLCDIYELVLIRPRLTSLWGIKNIKILKIEYADNLNDISFIRSLHLRKCCLTNLPEIRDVSPLYGIYDIHIEQCSSVVDLSVLGNH
jgi:hypothetical protein